MKRILISTIAVSALLFNVSCDTNFDQDVNDVVVSKGDADFTKYVALGNSLTSGYRDNALYIDGQNESYPSMIAKQMQLAGGGEFKQPMMSDNLGGIPALGVGNKLVLAVNPTTGALGPVVASGTATNTIASIFSSGPYNNMGVPGAKSYHLVAPGYGNPANLPLGKANPYFVRFAKNPATSSVLSDAMDMKPSFFSLWIGNNDVLSYATNGGMNSTTVNGVTTYTPAVVQTGNLDPTTYKGNDISDPNVVGGVIKSVLDGLKSVGSTKGVIANIPNVTAIPFFTKVRYNEIPLSATKAAALNSGLYSKLNAALPSRFNLVSAGQNPVIIVDNSLADASVPLIAAFTAAGLSPTQAAYVGNAFGKARQAKPGELILLTASNELGLDAFTRLPATETSQFVIGASFPLADQFSLTATEVTNISTAVTDYNAKISALASSYGLAFVDANAKMLELAKTSGIQFDGVKYTATFVTGGTFSLDGVHLTGRGYALIANEFIKSINAKYHSTLPLVNVNSYSGVEFP